MLPNSITLGFFINNIQYLERMPVVCGGDCHRDSLSSQHMILLSYTPPHLLLGIAPIITLLSFFIHYLHYAGGNKSIFLPPPYAPQKVCASHLVVTCLYASASVKSVRVNRYLFLSHTLSKNYRWHSVPHYFLDNSQYLYSRMELSVGQNAAFARRQLAICPPHFLHPWVFK